jgi:hypothetical protein
MNAVRVVEDDERDTAVSHLLDLAIERLAILHVVRAANRKRAVPRLDIFPAAWVTSLTAVERVVPTAYGRLRQIFEIVLAAQ